MPDSPKSPAEAVQAYAQCVLAGDTERLRAVVTGDFFYVHSSAKKESLEELVAALDGGRGYKNWFVDQIETVEYGDAATVTGQGRIEWDEQPPRAINTRLTGTAVRVDGGWRLAAAQSTRVAEA